MYITGPAVGQSSQASPSSSDALSAGGLDTTFAQLLIAQLKSQDPTSPMDPSQLVSQLVGLNTLDAVTSIYQLLYVTATAGSGTSAAPKVSGGN